jgi:hypothetical protein
MNAGGSRIFPGNTYSLSELNYEPQSGRVVIYLDGTRISTRVTLKDVETLGRGNKALKATTVSVQNGNETNITSDNFKYIVVKEKQFYTAFQDRLEVRTELASRGVYELADMPDFSLKRLTRDELTDLGLPQSAIDLLYNEAAIVPGFQAALYQDYADAENHYVLAFAGTDATDVNDIIEDIWQGLGWQAVQYPAAMELADSISRVAIFSGSNTTITGHSLGGGLASAASVVAGLPANTYNAAGLHPNTLLARDINGDFVTDINGNYVEQYPGSQARYDNPFGLITAYYMDWDILSLVQDSLSSTIPSNPLLRVYAALGNRIKLDGPYDAELFLGGVSFATSFASGQAWSAAYAAAAGTYYMGRSHLNTTLLYGLLVDGSDGGNLSGYEL